MKAKMEAGVEIATGFTYSELMQKVGNVGWGIAIIVCFLPRFFYLFKLVMFLQMDGATQNKSEARLSIVHGFNVLCASMVMSAVIPAIVAVIVGLNAKIFAQPIVNNVIGLIFAFWWRITYR